MEKWRGSLEGVAEQRPWKREREGGAQNREFRAPFFDATRSSGYGSSFSSALFCFFRRRGGSKTLFNSGVAAGDRLSLSGFWFTRTADAAARFYRVQGVERDPITVLYLYVRPAVPSEKDDRGGGGHGEGPINFLNVGRKDGRRVIKNKFVVFSEAAALGGFFKEAWRIFRKSLVLCEEKRARAWRCHWKLWRPVHGQKPIIPTHTYIYIWGFYYVIVMNFLLIINKQT